MMRSIHEFQKGGLIIRFNPNSLDFEAISSVGDKLHRLRSHEVWEDRLPTAFSKLFVVLGERCNMHCTYCYNSSDGNMPRQQNISTIIKAIDELVAQAQDEMEVSAVGGEPLLEWDLYKEMLDYAKKRCEERKIKFKTGIITNGSLLTPEIIDCLVSIDARVLLSIDGNEVRHDRNRKMQNGQGSFGAITKYLPYLLERSSFVEALAIMQRGETKIDKVVIELADLGFKHIGVNLVSTNNNDLQYQITDMPALDEAYGRLVDWLVNNDVVFEPFRTDLSFLKTGIDRQYYCNAGVDGVTLTVDGRYTVCPVLSGVPEATLGNISTGLDANMISHFQSVTKRDHQIPCDTCWAAPVCGGGCVSRKHAFTQQFNIPANIECIHSKIRLEWALVYHARKGE